MSFGNTIAFSLHTMSCLFFCCACSDIYTHTGFCVLDGATTTMGQVDWTNKLNQTSITLSFSLSTGILNRTPHTHTGETICVRCFRLLNLCLWKCSPFFFIEPLVRQPKYILSTSDLVTCKTDSQVDHSLVWYSRSCQFCVQLKRGLCDSRYRLEGVDFFRWLILMGSELIFLKIRNV